MTWTEFGVKNILCSKGSEGWGEQGASETNRESLYRFLGPGKEHKREATEKFKRKSQKAHLGEHGIAARAGLEESHRQAFSTYPGSIPSWFQGSKESGERGHACGKQPTCQNRGRALPPKQPDSETFAKMLTPHKKRAIQ